MTEDSFLIIMILDGANANFSAGLHQSYVHFSELL